MRLSNTFLIVLASVLLAGVALDLPFMAYVLPPNFAAPPHSVQAAPAVPRDRDSCNPDLHRHCLVEANDDDNVCSSGLLEGACAVANIVTKAGHGDDVDLLIKRCEDHLKAIALSVLHVDIRVQLVKTLIVIRILEAELFMMNYVLARHIEKYEEAMAKRSGQVFEIDSD